MKMRIEYTTTIETYRPTEVECPDPDETKVYTDVYKVEDLADTYLRDAVSVYETGDGIGIEYDDVRDYHTGEIEVRRDWIRPIIIDGPPDNLPPIARERLAAWTNAWRGWLRRYDRDQYDDWAASAPKRLLSINSKQEELAL